MNPIKNKKDLEATINDIRKFAYSYLEKYSPSKQQLRIYLFKKLIKKSHKISSKREIFNLIDSVILSLVDQKLLSDKYYSDAKSRVFLRKGYSLNKIRYNLINKGIDFGCDTFYGCDGIHETENINMWDNKFMFQSHIAGDWNDNCWNEKNYNNFRNILEYLSTQYKLSYKTVSEL